MTAVIVTAVLAIFTAGGITGAVLLVSLASRREDRRTLSHKAPNRIALAGRFVTGLRVEDPGSHAAWAGYPDSRDLDELELSDHAYHGQTPSGL